MDKSILATAFVHVFSNANESLETLVLVRRFGEIFHWGMVSLSSKDNNSVSNIIAHSPSKPKMWTEDYTGWFLSFGYPVPYRPVEDLAFAVARSGILQYFGGTNFGRTAGGPLVGTEGESHGLDNTELANSSIWTHGSSLPTHQSLIWYKSTFIAPEGEGPLSLNLASMGKGPSVVNGQNIGRYWSAHQHQVALIIVTTGEHMMHKNVRRSGGQQLKYCKYHIPRTWVNPGENLLVLHEDLEVTLQKSRETRTGDRS
ncbi:beta-galactosidase 8-like protein [Tanacetum coccineum]